MATIKDMSILVVDDDQAVRDSLRRALALQGYDVDLAADGEEALFKLRTNPLATDLLIVDVLMPRLDGLELTRRLRTDGSELPILMLTARDQVADKVAGFASGADDYLAKPFAFEELLARVGALLRRRVPQPATERLTYADLVLDPATREVWRGDEQVEDLTPREFDLLAYFLRHPRQVLTRDQIFHGVWGNDYLGGSNIIDANVSYLRDKLELGGRPRLIQTVRGVGYTLRERA
jgi:two-component system, OmpR family, response regulator MprA